MKKAFSLIIILLSPLLLSGCAENQTIEVQAPLEITTEVREPIKLMKDKKILFVAVPNFRDGELLIPKNIFSEQGAKTHIASLKKGDFVGNEGTTVEAEYSIDEVDPAAFDAVIFIGGPGMTKEMDNAELQSLAKKAMETDNLTAAICIAPAMMGKAGVLAGKKATVFPTGKGYLIEGGAEYTGKAVERDGKLITADGPESSTAFANEIINYFQ
jgi:protease I